MADALAELEALIGGMSPAEVQTLDKLIATELKQPWLPNPGPQSEAFYSQADLLLYGGAAGGGKLLDVETPIATPGGWTTMGALKPGSVVFDECGQPTKVTVVSPVVTDAKAYRLTFDDGSEITACADHLWLTMTDKERATLLRRDPEWRARRRACRPSRAKGNKSAAFVAALAARNARLATGGERSKGSVRSTQEIVDTLLIRGKRRNHSINVAGAIDIPDAILPIDPYVLGVWLGDGTSLSSSITGIDAEIWPHIEAAGYRMSHSAACTKHHNILGFTKPLREAGLLGNKHVPAEYLRGSIRQRLSLLQGLMDTDGHAALDGACEFDNTRKCLIDAVYELVVSLGMKASVTEGVAKLNGRVIGPKWRVKFMATMPVFRLARKANRLRRELRQTNRMRYVVDAIEVDSVPMRCIAVDSTSHLYLAGRSFIPTHNTDLIVGLTFAHQRVVIFRRAYGELSDLAERFLAVLGTRQGYSASPQPRYRDGKKLVEFGALERPGSERDWRGRAHDLICFDEGAELSVEKVSFVLGWLRSTDKTQRCRAVIASNPPTGGEGEWLIRWFAPWLDPMFADPAAPGELRWCFQKDDETIWVDGPGETLLNGESYEHLSRTFIPALLADNPYLKDTGYRATLQSLPEPLRSQLLKGDFLAGRQDHEWQVIPTEWVRLAQDRWKQAPKRSRTMIALAADVCGGGADSTVLAPLYEDSWFGPLIRKKGAEFGDKTMIPKETAMMLLQAQRDGADLSVDNTGGWGSGVRSHLKNDHELECASLVFSQASNRKTADGKLGFKNLRSDMYWGFREALDPESGEDVCLPPDPRLTAHLTAARYLVRGTDILIEDKAETKKRLGASPDDADAVVMAWHRRKALTRKPRAPKLPEQEKRLKRHMRTQSGVQNWMGR